MAQQFVNHEIKFSYKNVKIELHNALLKLVGKPHTGKQM